MTIVEAVKQVLQGNKEGLTSNEKVVLDLP